MHCLNERQRGEAIWFLLSGVDQISVPGRFHVSQSTLSCLRHQMLTTGSLNDHFRSGHPRVATQRQDQETPLLHLRNRFQAAVKTAVHF
jgi:transposase